MSKSVISQTFINFPDLELRYDLTTKQLTIIKITETAAEYGEASYLELTMDEALVIMTAIRRWTDHFKEIV